MTQPPHHSGLQHLGLVLVLPERGPVGAAQEKGHFVPLQASCGIQSGVRETLPC